MSVTYAEVVAQASELSPEERWRLITELIMDGSNRPKRSATEFFGINGSIAEDVDARIRRGRDE